MQELQKKKKQAEKKGRLQKQLSENKEKIPGDMELDRQNISSFWTIFSLYSTLTTGKIKILKQ